jgi:hypothetical protein
LADLVFDGVRAGGAGFEALQIGEESFVNVFDQVVGGGGGVVVEGAVGFFGGGPGGQAVGGAYDVGVTLAEELGLECAFVLEIVEVFEEEYPGGLLGVVELGGAAGFLTEDVVDVLEGLFEHGGRGAPGGRLLAGWYGRARRVARGFVVVAAGVVWRTSRIEGNAATWQGTRHRGRPGAI